MERGYDSLNSSDSEYYGEQHYGQRGLAYPDDSDEEYDSDDEMEYRGQGSMNEQIEKDLEAGVYSAGSGYNAADYPDA